MEERLEWIRRSPQAWAHWEALRGGLETHRRVAKRYPQAACHVVEADAGREVLARRALASSWWRRGPPLHVGEPPAGSVQMLWSNMHLHMLADPQATMLRWHRTLAPEGFLMFSCLGPDTLKSLRTLYATLGWPPPTQDFTDMHDWGDLLVESGFGEPVMDMERVRLAYDTPAQALAELAELGTNLHPGRFGALRARGWRRALEAALEGLRPPGGGAMELDFEIVYGHALRPLPRPSGPT